MHYTASEVRETANRIDRDGDELSCADTLHAFADMLEAREKAEPIGYVHPIYFLECDRTLAMEVSRVRLSGAQIPLYKHPAAELPPN